MYRSGFIGSRFAGLKERGEGNHYAETQRSWGRQREKETVQAESGVGGGSFYLQHTPSTPDHGK